MTGIEAKVLIETGVPFDIYLKRMIRIGVSTFQVAKDLEIGETSVRRYAEKYGLEFPKGSSNKHWGWKNKKSS